jgi:hypothetical protein
MTGTRYTPDDLPEPEGEAGSQVLMKQRARWVKQWHNEIDPVYAARPAETNAGFLDQTCARLHLKDEDLTAWRPPPTGRGRRKSKG